MENKRHPGLLTICKNYAEKKKEIGMLNEGEQL